ncbi:MAG: uL15 family ribosomal protein, partial [Candidatus Thiodiazotropha sp.]
LQRRLPKVGFTSRVSLAAAQVRLGELAKVDADVIDLDALKKANLVTRSIKRAKIFASGEIDRAVTVKGIAVTKGAKAAIEAAGGKVE